MGANDVVVLDHVTKWYRLGRERSNWRSLMPGAWGDVPAGQRFKALDDVSLTVEAGASVGIVGANGAGKSTLLRLIAGVVAPSSGRITTSGRIASVIELGVGFAPDFSGRENLRFAGALLGMSERELRRKEADIVSFAELDGFMDMPVKRYSSGMKARLGFSLVSAADADLFLFDEVFAVGDYEFRRRCFSRIEELSRRGAAMLLVSHESWQLMQTCGELHMFDHGRLAASGDPLTVAEAYLGPDFRVGMRNPEVTLPLTPKFAPTHDGRARIVDFRLRPENAPPGDPVEFEVTVEVTEPLPHANLVLTVGTITRIAFSRPVAAPADLLQRPGTWTVRGRVARVPYASGRYRVDAAIVEAPVDDLHSDSPCIDLATASILVTGGVSERAGFKLDIGWSCEPSVA